MVGPAIQRLDVPAEWSGVLARVDALEDAQVGRPPKLASWALTIAAIVGAAVAGWQTSARSGAHDENAAAIQRLEAQQAATTAELARIGVQVDIMAGRLSSR
jgi:hypothetical protein